MKEDGTNIAPADTGWRLRQLQPGSWYATNVRTGETRSLPVTLSLLAAIGHFNESFQGAGGRVIP